MSSHIVAFRGILFYEFVVNFPELEKIVPSLHMASVYTLLSELLGAHQIASAHLTHLKTVLSDASKGRYDRDKAIEIR